MKHLVLLELMRKFQASEQSRRKFKIFLGAGLAGLLLAGALIIWAGVAAIQQVAGLGANAKVQEQVRDLTTEIPNLPALAKVGCRDKVQSLLSVGVWLEKPVAANVQSLRDACWE